MEGEGPGYVAREGVLLQLQHKLLQHSTSRPAGVLSELELEGAQVLAEDTEHARRPLIPVDTAEGDFHEHIGVADTRLVKPRVVRDKVQPVVCQVQAARLADHKVVHMKHPFVQDLPLQFGQLLQLFPSFFALLRRAALSVPGDSGSPVVHTLMPHTTQLLAVLHSRRDDVSRQLVHVEDLLHAVLHPAVGHPSTRLVVGTEEEQISDHQALLLALLLVVGRVRRLQQGLLRPADI
mmetsp:Transcript_11970/g.22836  ORF Transcript_11970/g.22836 Transcript_11970/m.22836 type:complete len:236 (+) Transcript_11970:1402-2109(+)